MKFMTMLLALSLISNIFLAYHYFQVKYKPHPTKIVIEKDRDVKAVLKVDNKRAKIASGFKRSTVKTINGDQIDFEPAITDDEYSFSHAQAEMEQAKKDFYIKADISPETITNQEVLIRNYWDNYSRIAEKRADWEIPFSERKKLLSLEEKLSRDLEQAYGKEKWQRYKTFVDNYNKKVDEARAKGGVSLGGLAFSYY